MTVVWLCKTSNFSKNFKFWNSHTRFFIWSSFRFQRWWCRTFVFLSRNLWKLVSATEWKIKKMIATF